MSNIDLLSNAYEPNSDEQTNLADQLLDKALEDLKAVHNDLKNQCPNLMRNEEEPLAQLLRKIDKLETDNEQLRIANAKHANYMADLKRRWGLGEHDLPFVPFEEIFTEALELKRQQSKMPVKQTFVEPLDVNDFDYDHEGSYWVIRLDDGYKDPYTAIVKHVTEDSVVLEDGNEITFRELMVKGYQRALVQKDWALCKNVSQKTFDDLVAEIHKLKSEIYNGQ